MSVPTFETDRLLLKSPGLEDIPAYTKHFVDYEVIQYLSHLVPWPYPENGVEQHLKNTVLPNQGKDRWAWGIFLKDHPEELIGTVDLWRAGKPEHRGFWLGKQFWGNGYMTEAVAPITAYAFNALGFKKLVFANAVGNIGSRRVKEKWGCTRMGETPAQFVDPKFTTQELWELTKENWMNA